jgi:hypothetical protein
MLELNHLSKRYGSKLSDALGLAPSGKQVV